MAEIFDTFGQLRPRRLAHYDDWAPSEATEIGGPSWSRDRTFRAVFKLWEVRQEIRSYSSQTDLARTLGISCARVTQVLRLLRLPPEILRIIVALGDPLASPIVTERTLRPIVSLSRRKQREKVGQLLRRNSSQWNPPASRISAS